MTVRAAVDVFGSELKVQLIHHFLSCPGSSQADACRAIGAPQRSVSDNSNSLVGAGVLLEKPGRTQRAVQYTVSVGRLDELKRALNDYLVARSEP